MCPSYCNCDSCVYGNLELAKEVCDRFDGSSPFCRYFSCNVKDCKRTECISVEEMIDC